MSGGTCFGPALDTASALIGQADKLYTPIIVFLTDGAVRRACWHMSVAAGLTCVFHRMVTAR